MKKSIIAIILALALGGCAGLNLPGVSLPGKLGDLVKAVTTTIVNPVGETNIYQVENAYAAALQLAVEYREYCWARPYRILMADPVAKPICVRRRDVVRTFQNLQGNASAALVAAQNFIANNPTLNAASTISAAWQAVADFKGAIPARQIRTPAPTL